VPAGLPHGAFGEEVLGRFQSSQIATIHPFLDASGRHWSGLAAPCGNLRTATVIKADAYSNAKLLNPSSRAF